MSTMAVYKIIFIFAVDSTGLGWPVVGGGGRWAWRVKLRSRCFTLDHLAVFSPLRKDYALLVCVPSECYFAALVL
jgi:hypothetical protein